MPRRRKIEIKASELVCFDPLVKGVALSARVCGLRSVDHSRVGIREL